MVGIITEKMEKDQTNNSINNPISSNGRFNFYKVFIIAMIAMFAIIAIILANLIRNKTNMMTGNSESAIYSVKNISVHENTDAAVEKFIKDYFKARTELNYPKIFSCYGRDYYKEERESKDDSFRKTIDNIRYEKIFVSSYDNIKIYTDKGYHDDEIICIVTYDMSFGFTTDVAPMIIVFYLKKVGDSYIISENFDVGTSKYIVDVVNTDAVKALYNDVYIRLNRVLVSNESLKLVYNSFRQSEMNMNSDLGPLYKKEIIDKFTTSKLDPIKDSNEIYDAIVEKKREETKYQVLNDYLEKVIASLSDAQKAR